LTIDYQGTNLRRSIQDSLDFSFDECFLGLGFVNLGKLPLACDGSLIGLENIKINSIITSSRRDIITINHLEKEKGKTMLTDHEISNIHNRLLVSHKN